MSRVRSGTPIPFRIGDCQCPGEPHSLPGILLGVPVPAGDVALFRPRLTLDGGLRASSLLTSAISREAGEEPEAGGVAPRDRDAEFTARLGMVCLEEGILAWNILDGDGKPVPCTVEVLRSGVLDWGDTLEPLVSHAADLYGEEALRPLVRLVETASTSQASRSSGDGRTERSTSATRRSSRERRKRS